MAELLVRTPSGPADPVQRRAGTPQRRSWREPTVDILLAADPGGIADHDVYDTGSCLCVLTGQVRGGRGAAGVHATYRRGGLAAVARLDGQFVVLLHDRVLGETSVVRDKAGYGHGYYWTRGREVGISTSLPWLVRDAAEHGAGPPRVSARGLALYLTYQYVPAPDSMVEGIRQLEPGSVLRLARGGRSTVERIARFPASTADTTVPWEGGEDRVRAIGDHVVDLIAEEAADRLAGVERVGMTISGGIDTSTNAIVLVQRLGLRPEGFTATFREEFYDESPFAESVSSHLGIARTSVPIRPDLIEVLPALVRSFDSPNADQAALAEYALGQCLRERGCAAVVTGEGGDEVLGLPQSNTGELDVAALPTDSVELARHYLGRTDLAPAEQRARLFVRLGVGEDLAYEPLARLYEEHRDRTPLERVLFGQWRTWLIDGVYMKDSRVFRHFGVDPVFPMMGPALLQYVADLPLGAKLAGLDDKRFLRSVIGERLPDEIMKRSKHKFWLPTGAWLRGPARDFLRDHLRGGELVSAAFERTYLDQLLDEHERGESDHSRVLWGLLFLELWWAQLLPRHR